MGLQAPFPNASLKGLDPPARIMASLPFCNLFHTAALHQWMPRKEKLEKTVDVMTTTLTTLLLEFKSRRDRRPKIKPRPGNQTLKLVLSPGHTHVSTDSPSVDMGDSDPVPPAAGLHAAGRHSPRPLLSQPGWEGQPVLPLVFTDRETEAHRCTFLFPGTGDSRASPP